MRGAIPPLPQYTFMAWCLVKQRDNNQPQEEGFCVHSFIVTHIMNGVCASCSM